MPTSFVSKGKRPLFKAVILFAAFVVTAQACIWDGDTLEEDIKKNPTLADAILNPRPPQVDTKKLEERLKELLAKRNEADVEWWNNVAGTYLRLGKAKEAAELLKPVVSRFENNYGIHANLGTAYHLLGRYVEAEKHIARDLELKPEAHFGLEKYHLALLQYLSKSKEYQARHVYVDEFTWVMLNEDEVVRVRPIPLDALRIYEGEKDISKQAKSDGVPAYAAKYDLANDPKFQEGIIYLATLSPKEPACMTMLGMAALKNGDLNLAKKAFEKAILLGSPMEPVLKAKIEKIDEHIKKAGGHASKSGVTAVFLPMVVVAAVGFVFLGTLVLAWRKLRGVAGARAKD
jgi:hypothetical protein